MGVLLPPGLELTWAAPAWNGDGVILSFEHPYRETDRDDMAGTRKGQPSWGSPGSS